MTISSHLPRRALLTAASLATLAGCSSDTARSGPPALPASAREDDSLIATILMSRTSTSEAIQDNYTNAVRPELYGATGNGKDDDSEAFRAMLAAGVSDILLGPKNYLVHADVVKIPSGGSLRGTGSFHFMQRDSLPPAQSRLVIKADSGKVGVRVGPQGTISDVSVVSEHFSDISNSDADFPQGVAATSTGIQLDDVGVLAHAVTVAGFVDYGIIAGTTSRISNSYVRSCGHGIYANGADGWISSTSVTFCFTAGIRIAKSFWRLMGNRIEWCARYGAILGPHGTTVGNLFDRNGWAGAHLPATSSGQVITGNHFHRNGAGGDGQHGRWTFSAPDHASYVPTDKSLSCHIQLDTRKAVVIAGNRFSAGSDDSRSGTQSPCYVFSSAASEAADEPASAVVQGNVGLHGAQRGWVSSAYGGSGAIAGGTDTALIDALTRPFDPADGISTSADVTGRDFHPARAATEASDRVSIDVPRGRIGAVDLALQTSTEGGQATVRFADSAGGGNPVATLENVLGELAAQVSMAPSSEDAGLHTITVALRTAAQATYTVHYGN